MSESIDIDLGAGEKEGERSVLQVRVYYSKGGMNYMNYKQEPRGYYVLVQSCNVGNGFRSFMLTPGSNKGGFKQCFEQVKRLNRKRLEELQTSIHEGIDPDIIKQLWELMQLRAIYHQCLAAADIDIEEAA